MKVLVTGGTGFLGKRLKKENPNWIFLSSKDCDLTNYEKTVETFKKNNPKSIVHLAGRVGGIKDNASNQADFYLKNTLINTNVIQAAYSLKIPRVLSALSTCAFPNVVNKYPFSEEDIFSGPPADTNFSYGYTKRALHVQSLSYRKQYGVNYSTFCPSNIYGPEDHFDTEKSHFIPALVSKIVNAKENCKIELWGTGKPKRQQLYVDDLVKIIPILLEKHNSNIPLIVSPNENLTIDEMANIASSKVKKNIKFIYNGNLDGQYRKDGDNKKMKELIGDFHFTSFEDGIEKTIKWYMENR